MYPRTNYEMTKEDLKTILEACKPTPVMYGNEGCNLGGDQQENANSAWRKLGEKMGFDYMTVRPIDGKDNRFFTAVTLETEEQRKEREAKETERIRLEKISTLKREIENKKKELEVLL